MNRKNRWEHVGDYDLGTTDTGEGPFSQGMVIARIYRTVDTYPRMRVTIHRVENRGGSTVAVHTGRAGYDAVDVSDIDPAKLYTVLVKANARVQEGRKWWETRKGKPLTSRPMAGLDKVDLNAPPPSAPPSAPPRTLEEYVDRAAARWVACFRKQ